MDAGEGEGEIVARQVAALLDACDPAAVTDDQFWGAQFDHGLAWVQFPVGLGGLGVAPHWQQTVNTQLRAASAPTSNWDRNVVGIGMASGTLVEHASSELCSRLLRPLFTCDEIWCQLFSEPGAGSDLAGLATSARNTDGQWVINGQKVWTTLAHVARWGLLLARTDPDVPKHAGLTYFLVDMQSPGIEVRPLFEITGEAEFNEVYFDDVVIPDSNRLSGIGKGWSVAMTTLMNERVAVGGEIGQGGGGVIDGAMRTWAQSSDRTPARRDALTRLWIEVEILRLTNARAAEAAKRGTPGPEGSIAKLHWAELNKAVTAQALDQMGARGMLYEDGYTFERPTHSSVNTTSVPKAFLRSRANSIEGGTSEIMRNVLAERILGLPGESRADREVAWRDVPRS